MKGSVSVFGIAGMLVAGSGSLGVPLATTAPMRVGGGATFSGFRGGASIGAPARLAPSGGFTSGRGWSGGTAQWNTRSLPGTLPALNSNTLPALNSNTLPLLNGARPGFPSTPVVPPGGVMPPSNGVPPANCPQPPFVCPPNCSWYPWGWNGWVLWNGMNYVVYWNGWPVPTYVPGPFGGVTYLYDPNLLPGATQRQLAQQAQAPAPQPTAYDYGMAALQSGNSGAAVRYFREVVQKDKNDAGAMRLLAVSLLESRQPDDAAAMLRQAYTMDPTLAGRQLDADNLGMNSARRSSLVNRSVEYANRVNSASSWLMVSVMMQTDGRFELARRMLARASDQGLDPAVFKAMDSALAARLPLGTRPMR